MSDSETITADESYDYEATDVIDNVFADTDETPTPAPAPAQFDSTAIKQKRVGRINIHSNFDINTIEFDQDYNKFSTEELRIAAAIFDVQRIMRMSRVGTGIQIIAKTISEDPETNYIIWPHKSSELSEQYRSVTLNGIHKPGTTNINTNLWDFIHRPEVKKELMCRGYTFYSENPDYYSFFAGYPYKPAKEINYSVLQPILDHIRDQVCAGNSEVNNWFLSWYAFILQKPTGMTCTVPMLMGDQGCGKTSFCTDLMVKAIG